MTPRTKAVIVVHLFGNVAPIAEIEALGVPVIEDSAQAAGSLGADGRPGALGTIATFSFYPSKNLGAFGDGGAITTRDAALAERVRTLRFHGSKDKVDLRATSATTPAWTSCRPAILRVQLPAARPLGRRTAATSATGTREAGLGELVALPQPTPGAQPAWHLYVIRHERADELQAALAEQGIGARALLPHARPPPAADGAVGAGVELPGTAEAARTHLAIPMSAALTRDAGRRGRRRRRPRDARSGLTSPTARTSSCCGRSSSALRAPRRRGRASPRATSRRPSSCASASGSSTRSSAATAAGGWRPRRSASSTARRRWRAGPGAAGASTSPSATAPTTSPSPRGAAHPLLDDVRLRVGDRAAHDQLPAGPGGRRARGDPARAPGPLRRAAASCSAMRG